jgi:hypothetical protein
MTELLRWQSEMASDIPSLAFFVKKVPGFAVLVEPGDFLFFVWEEAQRFHRAKGIGWKDVPDALGNDEGDEQVDFVGLVGASLMPAAADVVSAGRMMTDTVC